MTFDLKISNVFMNKFQVFNQVSSFLTKNKSMTSVFLGYIFLGKWLPDIEIKRLLAIILLCPLQSFLLPNVLLYNMSECNAIKWFEWAIFQEIRPYFFLLQASCLFIFDKFDWLSQISQKIKHQTFICSKQLPI